jgi:hypothetical protein
MSQSLEKWEEDNGVDKNWIKKQFTTILDNQWLWGQQCAIPLPNADPKEIEILKLFAEASPRMAYHLFDPSNTVFWHMIAMHAVVQPNDNVMPWYFNYDHVEDRKFNATTKKYRHHHVFGFTSLKGAENILISEIGREIVHEIFSDLSNNACIIENVSLEDDVLSKVMEFQKHRCGTDKYTPNWIVCGPEVSDVLKSKYNFTSVTCPDPYDNLMPKLDGVIECAGKELLLVNNPMHHTKELLFGHKPVGECGPGYCYMPYIPLATMTPIKSPDYCPRPQCVLTRHGKSLWGCGNKLYAKIFL